MNHKFRQSLTGGACQICGYDNISHTSDAICEACGLTGECDFHPNERDLNKMLLCATCYKLEVAVTPAKPVHQSDNNAKSVYQVKTTGDYFNANIPAILDIQKAIEADETIPAESKKYELAKQVKNRLGHLAQRLFDIDKERAATANEQRDTLVFCNHLAKELSAEKQRELGLQDISYKSPEKPKKIKTPTAPTTKKFDKAELKKVAAEFNISEYILQSIVTARKVTVAEAAKIAIEIQTKFNGN